MSLVKKFASVGGATMASRVLGFVREALVAATLGAGPVADAFYAAFRFPNLFRRLFAEGAFNTAFIPLFAKQVEGGGEAAAKKFAEDVLSFLLAALIVISALALIFMPYLVSTIIAPKFAANPEKFDITVLLTRIMFPYLLCMSLVAMFSGILNSLRSYFLAAIVPVLLNVILIGVLLYAIRTGADARQTGVLMAWGVFASGFAQLAFLIRAVHKRGFSLSLKRPRMTPDVKRLMILMGPAALTGGVTQINLLIGQIIASAQDGAIALLNYADRINQLPLGVIGVAIGVVLLPELSRTLKAGNNADADHLMNRSIEFGLGLTLPAAVALTVMPEPIVGLLYQRGAFTPETTHLAAQALAAFAIGLPAYVLIKVFSPGFFAREDMKAPFWFSVIAVAINVVASLALFGTYGHVAIALATSISAWVNFILLAVVLSMRGYFHPSPATVRRSALIIAASFAMGIIIYFLGNALAGSLTSPSFGMRFLATFGVITAGFIVYFAVVIATKALDPALLTRMVRRRGGKKPA
jgi:putative peptidoglycan lipid II flippase